MRRRADRRFAFFLPALAALTCASFGVAAPASAKTHHRSHHYYLQPAAPAAPFTGFGPTAPGVSDILIDAGSGAVLSETGADIPRYPASLTKLMTLDLAFQALRDGRLTLDTPMPVSFHASAVEPVKLGLQPGDSITVRQAILAMTTMSANDAATVLGEYLGGGSEERCAEMMTLRAHALGMAQTEFYNASGLPNPNQITTARDLSILARDIVVAFPEDQPFFEVQQFNLNGHQIYSNNAMLKIYPGATGMKTGYTILARHNLITSAERNGKVLIGVELHEPSWGQTYSQMTALLDNGFGTPMAQSTTVAQYQPPAPSPLPQSAGPSLFSSANAATVRPVTAANAKPSGQPIQMAQKSTRAMQASWTAQLGIYSRMAKARSQAIAVREMRGVGIARIARVQSHGKTLWTAQLAGLTEPAAHATCSALAARGDSCRIIAPQADHLAERDSNSGQPAT